MLPFGGSFSAITSARLTKIFTYTSALEKKASELCYSTSQSIDASKRYPLTFELMSECVIFIPVISIVLTLNPLHPFFDVCDFVFSSFPLLCGVLHLAGLHVLVLLHLFLLTGVATRFTVLSRYKQASENQNAFWINCSTISCLRAARRALELLNRFWTSFSMTSSMTLWLISFGDCFCFLAVQFGP